MNISAPRRACIDGKRSWDILTDHARVYPVRVHLYTPSRRGKGSEGEVGERENREAKRREGGKIADREEARWRR